MLDSKYIRENLSKLPKIIESKGVKLDFSHWETLDNDHRKQLQKMESLKFERNKASKQISELKKQNKDTQEILTQVKTISQSIKEQETIVKKLAFELQSFNLMIPNIPHSSVPIGKNDQDNKTISTWGTPKEFNFTPLNHLELGESLKLFSFKQGAKITGRGFPVFTGMGAKLERALIQFFLDTHTEQNGFQEVLPPIIVNRQSMIGTGQIPKMEDDMYAVDEEKQFFLVPTAEVPITNLHSNETLQTTNLPISYVGYTPCFRKEAGAWGKDTRGFQRLHQFNKVEMVKFTNPEKSYDTLEELRGYAENLIQKLQLPYRVLELCTGDLSFGAAKCYDLEVYSPATRLWLEVSSVSNFEAFQARRANIRYKTKDQTQFVHTLNGSGLATPRILVALLEHYQNQDGSISVPEVLQPYLKTKVLQPKT